MLTTETEHSPVMATPDFYRYRWEPLSEAAVRGDFVQLTWPDGVELTAYKLWLWENIVGSGIDRATREGLIDPADLVDDIRLVTAQVTAEGALCVVWADGRSTEFHPGWLRHVADGHHRPSSWLPEPQSWTTDRLTEPPTFDGRAVAEALLTDDPNLQGQTWVAGEPVVQAWVMAMLQFGLARLTGVGTDPDLVLALGQHIGAVRSTNFGPVWEVRAAVELAGRDDTNSTANSTKRLGAHTDLPTRETPPGFQLLHCLANTAVGGHSTMTDGSALVDHLAARHPEHYEALTSLRWIFFNRGPSIDHRWSGPIIDGANGLLTLRAFYPVRAFPDMEPADMPRAYAAMRCLAQVAADPRFQMRYPLRPGDLVGFDNRRILHGREAYEADGERLLRGIYIDQDEVRSYARVANRRANQEANP